MKNPICCSCNTKMECVKNGVIAIEQASFGDYKVWRTDKFKCQNCDIEILGGFADKPSLINSDLNFEEFVEDIKKREYYTF